MASLSRRLRGPLPTFLIRTRALSSAVESSGDRRKHGPRPHEYARPSAFLGSWKDTSSSNPREALKRLDALRREYAKQVSERRKQYIRDVEEQRQERLRKEAAKKEAALVAMEERKAAKKKADEARAAKHRAFQEELRQTLLKERAEKLENWRAKKEMMETKKSEQRELTRKQSSMWINESELEGRIREAITDPSHL